MANETSADRSVRPSERVCRFRRIVTGHDALGNAVFLEDEICRNAFCMGGNPDFVSTELWRTEISPVDNSGIYTDPSSDFTLSPSPQGKNWICGHSVSDSAIALTVTVLFRLTVISTIVFSGIGPRVGASVRG